MNKEKKDNKLKLSVSFLIISLFLIFLSKPFMGRGFGFVMGRVTATIILWIFILGIIAIILWTTIHSNRDKKLLFFIFSILFLLASAFSFIVEIYSSYVAGEIKHTLGGLSIDEYTKSLQSNGNTYTDSENKFSITYPTGWEIKDKHAVKQVGLDGLAIISIGIHNFSEITEDIIEKESVRTIKVISDARGMEVEDTGKVLIDGISALWFLGVEDFELVRGAKSIVYVFAHNQKLYLISGSVGVAYFDEYENVFRDSILTFKVL